jgi:hypothetical protein
MASFQYHENVRSLAPDEARRYLAAIAGWPKWWPKQVTIQQITSPTTVVSYEDSEYPSLIDSSTGIDYDNPRHLDSYAAFCDRLSALVEDREPMYFLYKLVNWFKSVGGTYESAQFDTQYRRTIPLEIMEDFQDVMVRNEKLSRYMTFLLRHKGGKEILSYHGISMNENGFVDIGTLLRKDPRQQPSKFIPHLWILTSGPC